MSTANDSTSVPVQGSIQKSSVIQRSVNFVKTHKKATIAVAAVSGLVVANAYLSRRVDLQLVPSDLEPIEDPKA